MNNSDILSALIQEISGQNRILSIPRLYIDIVGNLDRALFLSQAVYWSDKGKKKGGWFYKTYEEWEDEISLSNYQVRKVVKALSNFGIIKTKVQKANGNPTVHYKVNMQALESMLRAHFVRIYPTGHYAEPIVGSHGLTGEQVGDTHTLAAIGNRKEL